MKANLKIVSDGTSTGTHLFADSKELQGVTSLSYRLEACGVGHAVVTFAHVALELEGQVDLEATFESPAAIFRDDAEPYPEIDPADVLRRATS